MCAVLVVREYLDVKGMIVLHENVKKKRKMGCAYVFCTHLGFAFGKTAYYFLLVSSKICVLAFYCSFRDMRADRQTDRQTDVLITLLRTANKKPLKIALENRCRSGSYASHHNVRHAAKKTARRRQLYVTDIVVLARRRPPSHGRRTDGRLGCSD